MRVKIKKMRVKKMRVDFKKMRVKISEKKNESIQKNE